MSDTTRPRHRLTDVDPEARTAVCSVCGPTRVRSKGGPRPGHGLRCNGPRNVDWRRGRGRGDRDGDRRPYRKAIKALRCQRCGWLAEDRRLLDVHHLDGNHDNNDEGNLMVLCPTCHRREHFGL